MDKIKNFLGTFSVFIIGFLIAFFGVSKPDQAAAAAVDMKSRIAFGKIDSPVEVYFVTDWYCPSCRKIEPDIEKMLAKIQAKTAFYFVDFPIHRKSLNFTPYNLSFLVHNKSEYLRARHILANLADKTESPTDEEIVAAAKKEHIQFKELSYLDVHAGIDCFEKICNTYDMSATPTIIITNTKTKKVTKFEGTDEISEAKVMKAIETLSK